LRHVTEADSAVAPVASSRQIRGLAASHPLEDCSSFQGTSHNSLG
jgi:hypothetical protein